jgi:glutathione synthase/RimK-type ligase-like ATP-grasp enzyme
MTRRAVRPVAVVGRAGEEPCRLLVEALHRQRTPTLVLDQLASRRAPTVWGLDEHGSLQGQAVVDGVAHALPGLAGIYLRPGDDRRLGLPTPAAVQAALAWTQAWVEIAELADCRVANRASAMASNSSKPLQSQCLAAAGFDIPPMLMSNDPQAVLAFEAEHGPLIYKSASGVRSIVSRFDAAARRRLAAVRHVPTLFQKCLRGTNLRVHVVGSVIFATEIDSDTLDYRYPGRQGGSTELRATRLTPEVEALCRRAGDALGLPFCGLDLMLADDGHTYCFEANPSPGYSYYESATGQPIAAALARYLAGRD